MIHGGDIYEKNIRLDFSVNLNPLGCPESVEKAVSESIRSVNLYPDIRYTALRQTIAGYENNRYSEKENPVKKDMIIPGSGASEIIMATAHAYAGKKVLVKLPVFAGYERAFENAGCNVSYSDPDDESDFISQITSENYDLIVIGSPANPTGRVLSPDHMKEIVSACKKAGSTLLSDEVFMGFVTDRKKCTFANFICEDISLIIIRSFTKLYCCPGLRLGYAVCSNAGLADLINAGLPEWNISGPAEKAMTALCGEGGFADKSTEYVANEREYMWQEMSQMGLDVTPSDANFIFFRSGAALYDKLLEKGILIRDCSSYKGIGGRGTFRIGIRKHSENDELLSALKELL